VTLSYEVLGDGRPVVILHWFGTDRSLAIAAMEPAFKTDTGWKRVYVDLPGHGGSSAVDATSEAVLLSVSDLVDEFSGDETPLIAGFSYGGYIAAGLARRRPSDFGGLLLVCPGVRILQPDRHLPDAAGAETSSFDWPDDVPLALSKHLTEALSQSTPEVIRRITPAFMLMAPGDEAFRQQLRDFGYRLADEAVTTPFCGPTSIITGRQDRLVGYSDQFGQLAAYPSGSFTVLDNAGHYLPFERPSLFEALVHEWLARIRLLR
jgi:pimeloyl-ACP methyl ester carboxylesterase